MFVSHLPWHRTFFAQVVHLSRIQHKLHFSKYAAKNNKSNQIKSTPTIRNYNITKLHVFLQESLESSKQFTFTAL